MIEQIIEGIWWFLNKFIAPPSGGGSGIPWSLEQIIRAESTHFLFSLFWGWVACCLIWTILSYSKHKEYDPCIWNIGLLWGLFVSVTTHIFIDSFTTLA